MLSPFTERAHGSSHYSQTVLNCVKTIYLFTSACPTILTADNGATLLPYLKNATGVSGHSESPRLLAHRLAGGGICDIRTCSQDSSRVCAAHAQDGGQVRPGPASNTTADGHQAEHAQPQHAAGDHRLYMCCRQEPHARLRPFGQPSQVMPQSVSLIVWFKRY